MIAVEVRLLLPFVKSKLFNPRYVPVILDFGNLVLELPLFNVTFKALLGYPLGLLELTSLLLVRRHAAKEG